MVRVSLLLRCLTKLASSVVVLLQKNCSEELLNGSVLRKDLEEMGFTFSTKTTKAGQVRLKVSRQGAYRYLINDNPFLRYNHFIRRITMSLYTYTWYTDDYDDEYGDDTVKVVPSLERADTQSEYMIDNDEKSDLINEEFLVNHVINHKDKVFADKKIVYLKKLYNSMMDMYKPKHYAIFAQGLYKYESALKDNGIEVGTKRCPGGKDTVKLKETELSFP